MPILDVHSQGETEKQAPKNLEEALSLFFLSCFERGVLDEVLKKCGFKAAQSSLKKEQPIASKKDYIDVPIPFLVNQNTLDACHA